MHATTIASKSVALPTPRAAVGTTHAAMFAAAARLEAQLAFARVEYPMPCWAGSRRPQPVERRGNPSCKRPLSPVMLVATDVTEPEDFEDSPMVVCDSSSADARAHAGAQPSSKRQRWRLAARGGRAANDEQRVHALRQKFGFKPW
jgi:hypothetical protein